ncbi:bsr3435 [Bradyrhizobium diazoefficiens USDA 110]|uniref:Bsr3435 protein n=1 Tax=Bradyrhizobium diazoefficiens (strain JCM 10833 / BCRC 13528 / IAM 13628 / NBRC 14792 / USDA 110) TaxID=224911 RepID=Q89PP5_BRADU|nr:hypothetical protein CO678_00660 [Bradyrhizobium diazoefficiens]QBP22228.1 hypothetical protein Bdiaspc4_17745 [Bradyrhizobium diazoefficiens]BAC48700.1 bsr3435 [Bradyrhizobium diazoefficiens USDA 110]
MPKVNSRLSLGASDSALPCVHLALYLKIGAVAPGASPRLLAEPTLTRPMPTKYFMLKIIRARAQAHGAARESEGSCA